MTCLDRKKLESCESYEPPEVAALGDLGKLTLGSGKETSDFAGTHMMDIAARSAYEDEGKTPSKAPGSTR